MSTIRVLIADDQPMLRAGLRTILEEHEEIVVVGEAGDGCEAIERARALRPHVVLMDVRMPTMDGIEATQRLGTDVPNAPQVLILTTFDLDEYVYDSLRVGASGFLLKDVPPDDLVRAVRTVAQGDPVLSPSATRRLVREFAGRPAHTEPREASRLEGLTTRETEVLQLVASGLANAEIAEQMIVSEATVKSHVGRVLAKLGLRNRVQAAVLAYEAGLVELGSAPLPHRSP